MPLAEINSNGQVISVFGYGAAGLSERYEPNTLHKPFHVYTYDMQGNVCQRTTSTSTLPFDFSAVYDAYGAQLGEISAATNPNMAYQEFPSQDSVGYRGQSGAYTDNETSPITLNIVVRYPWVYAGGQYYDPAAGRDLSRGPGGPIGVNPYAFAGNNPIADSGIEGQTATEEDFFTLRTLGDALAGGSGRISHENARRHPVSYRENLCQ